ncbi:hypothetical protein [Cellulomonas xylanilytica]|uniref:Fibronectin type-III domain-containing protein n=1 Tax=Cellulomonas xylanilytica TaxID=233583 RepID=A0A510VA73_9CELL|nr:hypothetical protein [Cellulomonas xylanilytica]GEK22075.1 hypothetical protein CXY01_25950 [Cellulomonas xylanilytica]
MSSLDERADGRATAPAGRAVRRATGVLGVLLALVMVGSGTAWAWWTDARSVNATAGTIDIRPGTPTCVTTDPDASDGSNSPATISWAPPVVPAGSTVTYTVTAVPDTGTTRTLTPSPSTATSMLVYPSNFGDSTRPHTVTVTATVTFPGGAVWTSPASGSVKAQAVRALIFWLNMRCPA